MSLPASTEAYMLHRPPLRLVDKLLWVEGDSAAAETTLHPGDVGVSPDGRLEAAVLVELVAQTYAASQGYRDSVAGKSTGTGYLVGVQGFRIEDFPPTGRLLQIRVRTSCDFGEFHFVEGEVLCGNTVVAGGTLKIWVQPDAADA